MNVYCVKDNTLMVQHEDQYVCLKCETRVRLEFLPDKANCTDGICESFRVDEVKTLKLGKSSEDGKQTPPVYEGAKPYNDV